MKENLELFKQIGPRIKASRKASGYTQEKLSELIGVSVQYVSDLERGVVGTSIPTLIRICNVLHVTSDYLLLGRTAHSAHQDDAPEIYQKVFLLPKEKRVYVDSSCQLLLEALSNNDNRN